VGRTNLSLSTYMRASAPVDGYFPTPIKVRRSRRRSLWLNPKIRAVTSPTLVCGWITTPSSLKYIPHRSMRGLKNRQNPPVPIKTEPTSLPFWRLQNIQAYAKLSASVDPPCFTLIM